MAVNNAAQHRHNGPLRRLIGAMLNAAVRSPSALCTLQTTQSAKGLRRGSVYTAMRGVLPRKAQSARHPWLAHARRQRNQQRCAKALSTPRALTAAARGTNRRAVLGSSAFARFQKIPPLCVNQKWLQPCGLPFPFLVATPRPNDKPTTLARKRRRTTTHLVWLHLVLALHPVAVTLARCSPGQGLRKSRQRPRDP